MHKRSDRLEEFSKRHSFELGAVLEDTLADLLMSGIPLDEISIRYGTSTEIFAYGRMVCTIFTEFSDSSFTIRRVVT